MFFFRNIYQHLNKLLPELASARGLEEVSCLTEDIHVWPDLHGNRSPIADPTLRGIVSTSRISQNHGMNPITFPFQITGLDMTRGIESLAIKYLAFVQALAVSMTIFLTRILKTSILFILVWYTSHY